MSGPSSFSEAKQYRYGAWAGNPKGYAYDISLCAEDVPDSIAWFTHQCSRKNGHGPDGIFCKQHAKKHAEHNSQRESSGA